MTETQSISGELRREADAILHHVGLLALAEACGDVFAGGSCDRS